MYKRLEASIEESFKSSETKALQKALYILRTLSLSLPSLAFR
jgi:hypothetical protein